MKLKNFKEWQWLFGSVVSVIAHNLMSALLGREEAVFFMATFVFLAGFIISLLNRLLNNYWLVMLVLIVLGLDLAAISDISRGLEPNYIGEYAVLIGSIPIFFFIKNTSKPKKTKKK